MYVKILKKWRGLGRSGCYSTAPAILVNKLVHILISFFVVAIIISVLIVCKHGYLEWDMVMSTSKLFLIGI